MSLMNLAFRKTKNIVIVSFMLSMTTFVHPVCAGETTSSFTTYKLTSNYSFPATVPPTDGSPFEYHRYEVITHELTLQAGERRRVTGQLALSLDTNHPQYLNGLRVIPYANAEANSFVSCFYYNSNTGAWDIVDEDSAGTNLPGTPGHVFAFSNSLILKAHVFGLYRCAVISYVSDNHTSDFFGIAHANNTYLQISAADENGAEQFVHEGCASTGAQNCEYVPRKTFRDIDDPNGSPGSQTSQTGDPRKALITTNTFKYPGDVSNPDWYWTALDSATHIDVLGTFQVTSCPFQTSSCISYYWGPDKPIEEYLLGTYANIVTSVHFDQLYPDGSLCKANQSPDKRYAVSNNAHHYPVNYHLSLPVSQTCMGSRKFRVAVEVRWESGDPLKIDGGTITVINSARNDTTTVPSVSGMMRDQAIATLHGSGLAPAISGIINPAPVGLVLDQNSPVGTVEPMGSTVNLTVSLGSTTVPNLVGAFEATATNSIVAANLTLSTVHRPNSCVDPGVVQSQSPAPGLTVGFYTPVTVTIPSCTRRPGGGGGVPSTQ